MGPGIQNYTPIATHSNYKRNRFFLVGILIVFILMVFAGFIFVRQRQRQEIQIKEPATEEVFTTQAPSPTPKIEQEIEAVDLGTDEADFNTIQQDIDQL